MTDAEIRKLALDILGGIAPEADFALLKDNDELREVLDLDSMDFLNFIAGLHKATGADIPEADYSKLFTLRGVLDYLSGSPPPPDRSTDSFPSTEAGLGNRSD